jgi:hypothetical protein
MLILKLANIYVNAVRRQNVSKEEALSLLGLSMPFSTEDLLTAHKRALRKNLQRSPQLLPAEHPHSSLTCPGCSLHPQPLPTKNLRYTGEHATYSERAERWAIKAMSDKIDAAKYILENLVEEPIEEIKPEPISEIRPALIKGRQPRRRKHSA